MTEGYGGGREDPATDDAARRHGDGEAPRPGEEDLFAALERTRAELGAAPAPRPPEDFASRMQAALAAERSAGGPPATAAGGPGHPKPRALRAGRTRSRPPGRPGPPSRRRRVVAGGVVALAVAAAVVAGLAVGTSSPGSPAPTAAPPVTTGPASTPSPVPVSGADPVRALRSGLGARDPGPLSDPARRSACLVAHGLPADTVPVGSRQVLVDGTPGTLLVLPTGRAARFRLLAVGPACAPGSPSTLVDLTVGG
ncbi:hypothetical protein LQ327_06905 [Actinomycetospora endophytica]|uniref:Anti-sigma-K factor rskA n=1 Tax=Actinomycetospora endophytica TaxID=2291215 RepID=A0ABS8P5A7_9PSEU|nr:hypothetical protein [Actinomycetospora endophytica]MCD2193117.1 hypothetical protein [Actinomycetospora endophytica]